MSFFNQTRKTINISTYQISDPKSFNQINLFSKNITFDLILFREYVNTVMYPIINTLTSKPRYPKDILEVGLSGETIVTWLESQGNSSTSSELYWNSLSQRPRTVKESFDYLSSRIGNTIVQNITNVNADLEALRNELLELINDVSDVAECNRDNVTRLALDVFGSSYILDCTNTATLEISISQQISNLKTALGFNVDGTKNNFTSTNYINANSTVVDAIEILDEQLKLVADSSGGGPIDDSTYAKKPENNTFVSATPSEILTNKFVTDLEVTRGDFKVIKEASSNFYLYTYSKYGLDKDEMRLQFFTSTDNGATRIIKSVNLTYDSQSGAQPYTYAITPNGYFIRPNSSLPYTNNYNVSNIKLESNVFEDLYLELAISYDDPPVLEGYPNDIELFFSKSNSATPTSFLVPFTIDDSQLNNPQIKKVYKFNPYTLATTLITNIADPVTYENEGYSFSPEPEEEKLVFDIDSSTGIASIENGGKIKFKSPGQSYVSGADEKIIFNSDATTNTSNNPSLVYKRGTERTDRYISWKEYNKGFETNQFTFKTINDEAYFELYFSYNADQSQLSSLVLEVIEYDYGTIPMRMPLTSLSSSVIAKVNTSSYDHSYKLLNSPYSNDGYSNAMVKLDKNRSYYIKLNYSGVTGGVLQITMKEQNETGIQKTITFSGGTVEDILSFSFYDNSLNTSYINFGNYFENKSYDPAIKVTKNDNVNEQKAILLNSGSYSANTNVSIEVERGSSVRNAFIKWNEEVDKWQFYPAIENALPGSGTTNQILAWDDSDEPQWKTLSVNSPFVFHTRMDRFNYTLINGSTKTSYSQDKVSFEGLTNTIQLFSYRDSNNNELQPGQINGATQISLWDGDTNALYSPPYFAVYTNTSIMPIYIGSIKVNTEMQSDLSIMFVPVKFNGTTQVLYERGGPGDYSLFYTGDYLVGRKFSVTSQISIDNNEFLNGNGEGATGLDFITLVPGESIALVMLEIGGKSQFDTYFKPYVKGLNITYSGYSINNINLT
jgi:hypothetical protein